MVPCSVFLPPSKKIEGKGDSGENLLDVRLLCFYVGLQHLFLGVDVFKRVFLGYFHLKFLLKKG